MQVEKQQLELDMEQWTGFKLGKEYVKAIYYHPAYLTYMQRTSCEMLGWMNDKLESRLQREIPTLRYNDITLMAEREEELKNLLMRVKEESEKAGLKLNIQKTKIMASGPITSWQTDGGKVETVTDFIFLGSKITVDGDYSHEIKRLLLLRRKAMTNPDSLLNSRDITLPTNVLNSQSYGYPVTMYGCEHWTMKKAEHQRSDVFELWRWRRLLRVPWTARRSK